MWYIVRDPLYLFLGINPLLNYRLLLRQSAADGGGGGGRRENRTLDKHLQSMGWIGEASFSVFVVFVAPSSFPRRLLAFPGGRGRGSLTRGRANRRGEEEPAAKEAHFCPDDDVEEEEE